jgi:hypothetical protein
MTTTSTNTNNVRKESSLKKVPITHLECHGRESSNAQVLTNVAEHCEGTRKQNEELHMIPQKSGVIEAQKHQDKINDKS